MMKRNPQAKTLSDRKYFQRVVKVKRHKKLLKQVAEELQLEQEEWKENKWEKEHEDSLQNPR